VPKVSKIMFQMSFSANPSFERDAAKARRPSTSLGIKWHGACDTMKSLIVLALLLGVASSAFPQSRYDPYPNSYLRPTESATQSKLDEMQRRLEQSEFERQLERDEQKAAAEEAANAARQEAEERAEQAKQEAEERAAEIENRERLAAAKSRNYIYMIFALLLSALILYKIGKDKRSNPENALNTHEKTGVLIAVTGISIMLCALFMSSPWVPHLDIWQNLMLDFMTIDFWPNIQTKFVVLPCIVLAFYGALVYFEILRAPKFLLSRFEG
jgi:hypothetical protein